MLWGLFINVVVVFATINAVIWWRERRRAPVLNDGDGRELFGGATRQFGGADILGAVLLVAVNLVGGLLIQAIAPGQPASGGAALVFLGRIAVIWFGCLLADWAIIAWRNAPFLDRKWSAVAAVLIQVAGLAAGLFQLLLGAV